MNTNNHGIHQTGELQTQHRQPISKIIFHNRSKTLVTCSLDNNIEIWRDLNTNPEHVRLKAHSDWIKDIIFLNDGRLVSCAWDKTIKIWDIIPNTPVCETTIKVGKLNIQTLIQWKDNILIGGTYDGSLCLWDIKNKESSHALSVHKLPKKFSIKTMVLLESNYLAIPFDSDIYIYYINPNTLQISLAKKLLGHKAKVIKVLTLIGRDNLLISGDENGAIKLWQVSTGRCMKQMTVNIANIQDLHSINGRVFITSGNGVQFWDIQTGGHVTGIRNEADENFLSSFTISDTSESLAYIIHKSNIKIFKYDNLHQLYI